MQLSPAGAIYRPLGSPAVVTPRGPPDKLTVPYPLGVQLAVPGTQVLNARLVLSTISCGSQNTAPLVLPVVVFVIIVVLRILMAFSSSFAVMPTSWTLPRFNGTPLEILTVPLSVQSPARPF